MTFKLIPLDMINPPNAFAPLKNGRWDLVSNNATTIWFQLYISDSLGERRYIPAVGSTLELTFMRADSVTASQQMPYQISANPQNIVKIPTQNGSDKSLYSLALSATDVANIVSGSLLVKLTESGVPATFLQPWMVTRKLSSPGC